MFKKIFFYLLIVNLTSLLFAQNRNFPFYPFAQRFDFGDIMPKDQGGKFIQMELINTESDALIVQKIRNGLLSEIYGNPINWEKYEKTEIEKSVWLNRFYYLPSFAKMYYVTKDKSYLRDMMSILITWIKDNPRLEGSEKRTYNWRDMQVAWRSINLTWCYYLGKNGLSSEDKSLIINLQKEHASVLLTWFGKQQLDYYNHQSHGGLAMLYIASMFPELDRKKELEINAMRILTHHTNNAFYNDGGNLEQMFGYYPFETSIFRDMYLLCSSNNIKYPDNLIPLLKKMTSFLSVFSQPDETMPPVNDSYEMTIIPTISILNSVLKFNIKTKSDSSAFLTDTQIAVMRSGNDKNKSKWYILINPAVRIGTHAHAGALGFHLWYNNKPVLVDAGCCSYDNPLKNKWYRTSKAHNTVLIDGKQDAESSSEKKYVKKRDADNRIIDWENKENYKYCKMVSQKSELSNCNVKWERNIALIKDEFAVIYDYSEATEPHKYEILFHTLPVGTQINHDFKVVSIYKDSLMTIIPVNADSIDKVEISNEFVCINGLDHKAPMLNYSISAAGNLNSVFILMPRIKDFAKIKVQKKINVDGLGLQIENEKGERRVLLFKKSESKEIKMFGVSTTNTFDFFENSQN